MMKVNAFCRLQEIRGGWKDRKWQIQSRMGVMEIKEKQGNRIKYENMKNCHSIKKEKPDNIYTKKKKLDLRPQQKGVEKKCGGKGVRKPAR